ncbi:unnamed protein product [Cylindrotheca closterium]|uniref:Uncharacterized protein n=1 Tax=Cylindrotheca closterium TaxID=2856 RepID=A0AAD2JGX0_9STRA|nr:unnamed protein product [Cylindrotheca closterium]
MRFLLVSALLTVVSIEAFYPDGIDGPDPPNNRDGDSKYDIPHIFFEPNTDVSMIDIDIGSSVPSDAPSLVPSASITDAPSLVPSAIAVSVLFSEVPSDLPSLVPSALASDAPSNVPTVLVVPTSSPTAEPTAVPTDTPSVKVTERIDAAPLITETPTVSPTSLPTNGPTLDPTSGPTLDPTSGPTPDPTGTPSMIPTGSPTVTPTAPPTLDPTGGPTGVPSVSPTMSERFANEISDTILPSLLSATRSSKHRFQWGGTAEGCTHEHPPVFISCGAGGFLNQVVGSDAVCENLSNDRARCDSTLAASDEDGAYVDFQCSGVTKSHLTATAEIFPSTAESCDMKVSDSTNAEGQVVTTRGGNAAVFGVLGRVCKQNNGETRLENVYDCNTGTRGVQGDVSYCASGSMCAVNQACTKRGCNGATSCPVEVGVVSMSNSDDREACSFPENGFNLVSATFQETKFATFHEVDWTFSGQDLGCRTFTPDLTLSCKSGGEVQLGDTYPYCLEAGSTITCTNPFGSHDNVRETLTVKVTCLGDSYDQLELEANLPELNDEGSLCTDGALAIQGVSIKKSCSDDQFVSSPSFCVDFEAIFDDENLCYSKFECFQDTCEGTEVIIPSVSALSFSPETRYCVRAA